MSDLKDDQAPKDELKTETDDQAEDLSKEDESKGKLEGDEASDKEKSETQDQEVEVVRESKDAQSKHNLKSASRRIGSNKTAVNQARTEGEASANADLAMANEKIRLLQMAVDQRREADAEPVAPKLEDFDDDPQNPEYLKASQAFNDHRIQKEVARQVNEATKHVAVNTNQDNLDREFAQVRKAHYEKADELGAKDYDATEKISVDILGNDTTRHILNTFGDSSPALLYYLGKNPEETENVKALLSQESTTLRGFKELCNIESDLKIRPKQKQTTEPDESLPGGSKIASSSDAEDERMLAKAHKVGNPNIYLDYKAKKRKGATQKVG